MNDLSVLRRRVGSIGGAALMLTSCVMAAQGPADRHGALADQLLATDRKFAADAASRNVVDALTAMFRDDVTMQAPQGFVTGRDAARATLLSNPANGTSRADWRPFRAGVSADGTHGFTVGFMTMHVADGTTRPAKYIAYWIRDSAGWRVAAYKRAPAGPGEPPRETMAPSLPSGVVAPVTDPAALEAHAASLRAAEKAFSDEAQVIGVGPAFAKWGRDDATNMGDPKSPAFTVGAQAIGAGNSPAGEKTKIEWSADRVLVASSGDLGVTFGYIRTTDGSRPPSAFFTIWRRDSPSSPWRYIAE